MIPQEIDALPEENEHIEFKEAKHNFHFEKLVEYCVALANEGGGRLVLGVSDQRPRRVVGTQAFELTARTCSGVHERLQIRIEAHQLPPYQCRLGSRHTTVVLSRYKTLAKLAPDERTQAVYQHCCLRFVSNQIRSPTTNRSARRNQADAIRTLLGRDLLDGCLIAAPGVKAPDV